MAVQFVGISAGQQVTRQYVRVTLAGGFALTDLLSGPFSDLTTWAGKIQQWRDGVASGDFPAPAATSLAAYTDSGHVTPESRAVVDVHVLGAPSGLSWGDVAAAMDTLTPRVDVLSLALIGTLTDETGRSATLQDAQAKAATESLQEQVFRFLRKAAVVLGLAAGVLLLAVYLINRRK